jgi:hypothetical protein
MSSKEGLDKLRSEMRNITTNIKYQGKSEKLKPN